MAEGKFKFVSRIGPYGDGSGYQATATVEDRDDGQGVTLRIEIVDRLDLKEWPALRQEIDNMAQLAGRK